MTSKQDSIKVPRGNRDTRERVLACLVCGFLAASLWWIPGIQDFLLRGMRSIQDHQAGTDVRMEPREDFVFLGIDASSMNVNGVAPEVIAAQPALQRMKGQWPWDRRVHADVIDRLADAGAKLIVLDLVFAQSATPEEDKELQQAIARHRDKVVLASVFVPQAEGVQVLEPIESLLGPLEDETQVGYANFWPHAQDRLVKRSNLLMTRSEADGTDAHPDEPVFMSLAAAAAQRLGYEVPHSEKRFRMQRVKGKNVDAVYPPKSLYTIFVTHDWETKYEDGKYFRDKIVFIGPAAPTFQDSHDTPAGQIYGAQLHMHVLGAILEDAWYEEAAFGGGGGYFIVLLVIGLIVSCLVVARWGKTIMLAVAAALGVVVWYVFEILFVNGCDRLLGSLSFATVFVASVLGAIIWQAMTERVRRQQLHRHLQRSMSPDVADAIVQAPEGYYVAASGNRRQVTVLFADVRGFTNRSEQQDAGELVSQLNEYLGRMVEVIFAHGGTVDKFIGDAIMATWGGLDDSDLIKQNDAATNAAQGMLEALADLNTAWKTDGKEPFKIGIGVHHGEAIVGEVGSDQRTDFTVIGDTVNLASRIEGMTKAMGVDLLITSAVAEKFSETRAWQNVGAIRVKGKQKAVELLTPKADSAEAIDLFGGFLQEFQKGELPRASEILSTLESCDELEGLVLFYQTQIAQLNQREDALENWDGVLKMETK